MPERPLLILPSPGDPVTRRQRHGGGGKFHRPTPERQSERLSPQFERLQLQQTLEERRARLQMEARDLGPEEVAVLETAGTVDEFIRAVEAVPGMEWLAEVEAEEIPPDDDFFALIDDGEARPDKALRGRVRPSWGLTTPRRAPVAPAAGAKTLRRTCLSAEARALFVSY